jgi:hypothetical protein
VSKAVVAKIKRKATKIKVTQSPNVIITTIRVEIIVAPSTNVVKSGVLIGSATNLGCGSSKVLIGRNLNRNSKHQQ